MPNLYPSSMKNVPPNPNVPVYSPDMEPQSPQSRRRRKEQLTALRMPIGEMLKELWHCKLQQQCPVDSAGELSTWPPGQKMLSDIVQHATPTPLCEYPVKPLKGILEKDYASYAASLYEEAGIVDHRIVTRLMPRARPSPQKQYPAFRDIPIKQPTTEAISASSLELDAKHWRSTKAGLISTAERFPREKFTSDNNRPYYDVHKSIPKRSIMNEVVSHRHGSKMPVRSQKGLQLITRDMEGGPSPAHYSVLRPFGLTRPSKLTTHPEDYQAWNDMLDASCSAQQALAARHSVRAAGACIGNMFKLEKDCAH